MWPLFRTALAFLLFISLISPALPLAPPKPDLQADDPVPDTVLSNGWVSSPIVVAGETFSLFASIRNSLGVPIQNCVAQFQEVGVSDPITMPAVYNAATGLYALVLNADASNPDYTNAVPVAFLLFACGQMIDVVAVSIVPASISPSDSYVTISSGHTSALTAKGAAVGEPLSLTASVCDRFGNYVPDATVFVTPSNPVLDPLALQYDKGTFVGVLLTAPAAECVASGDCEPSLTVSASVTPFAVPGQDPTANFTLVSSPFPLSAISPAFSTLSTYFFTRGVSAQDANTPIPAGAELRLELSLLDGSLTPVIDTTADLTHSSVVCTGRDYAALPAALTGVPSAALALPDGTPLIDPVPFTFSPSASAKHTCVWYATFPVDSITATGNLLLKIAIPDALRPDLVLTAQQVVYAALPGPFMAMDGHRWSPFALGLDAHDTPLPSVHFSSSADACPDIDPESDPAFHAPCVPAGSAFDISGSIVDRFGNVWTDADAQFHSILATAEYGNPFSAFISLQLVSADAEYSLDLNPFSFAEDGSFSVSQLVTDLLGFTNAGTVSLVPYVRLTMEKSNYLYQFEVEPAGAHFTVVAGQVAPTTSAITVLPSAIVTAGIADDDVDALPTLEVMLFDSWDNPVAPANPIYLFNTGRPDAGWIEMSPLDPTSIDHATSFSASFLVPERAGQYVLLVAECSDALCTDETLAWSLTARVFVYAEPIVDATLTTYSAPTRIDAHEPLDVTFRPRDRFGNDITSLDFFLRAIVGSSVTDTLQTAEMEFVAATDCEDPPHGSMPPELCGFFVSNNFRLSRAAEDIPLEVLLPAVPVPVDVAGSHSDSGTYTSRQEDLVVAQSLISVNPGSISATLSWAALHTPPLTGSDSLEAGYTAAQLSALAGGDLFVVARVKDDFGNTIVRREIPSPTGGTRAFTVTATLTWPPPRTGRNDLPPPPLILDLSPPDADADDPSTWTGQVDPAMLAYPADVAVSVVVLDASDDTWKTHRDVGLAGVSTVADAAAPLTLCGLPNFKKLTGRLAAAESGAHPLATAATAATADGLDDDDDDDDDVCSSVVLHLHHGTICADTSSFTVPESGAAGNPLEIVVYLRDSFGNAIADLAVDELQILAGTQLLTDIYQSLNFYRTSITPVRATDALRVCVGATDPTYTLGKFYLLGCSHATVTPSIPTSSNSVLSVVVTPPVDTDTPVPIPVPVPVPAPGDVTYDPAVLSYPAGSSVEARLQLKDQFDNAVTHSSVTFLLCVYGHETPNRAPHLTVPPGPTTATASANSVIAAVAAGRSELQRQMSAVAAAYGTDTEAQQCFPSVQMDLANKNDLFVWSQQVTLSGTAVLFTLADEPLAYDPDGSASAKESDNTVAVFEPVAVSITPGPPDPAYSGFALGTASSVAAGEPIVGYVALLDTYGNGVGDAYVALAIQNSAGDIVGDYSIAEPDLVAGAYIGRVRAPQQLSDNAGPFALVGAVGLVLPLTRQDHLVFSSPLDLHPGVPSRASLTISPSLDAVSVALGGQGASSSPVGDGNSDYEFTPLGRVSITASLTDAYFNPSGTDETPVLAMLDGSFWVRLAYSSPMGQFHATGVLPSDPGDHTAAVCVAVSTSDLTCANALGTASVLVAGVWHPSILHASLIALVVITAIVAVAIALRSGRKSEGRMPRDTDPLLSVNAPAAEDHPSIAWW
jgi:hypothetical protein